jgi:hypothetical protein
MQKIANGCIYITNDHKAHRYFKLSCKQIDGSEIQQENHQSVADSLNNRPFQGFSGLNGAGKQFFYHGKTYWSSVKSDKGGHCRM